MRNVDEVGDHGADVTKRNRRQHAVHCRIPHHRPRQHDDVHKIREDSEDAQPDAHVTVNRSVETEMISV